MNVKEARLYLGKYKESAEAIDQKVQEALDGGAGSLNLRLEAGALGDIKQGLEELETELENDRIEWYRVVERLQRRKVQDEIHNLITHVVSLQWDYAVKSYQLIEKRPKP